MKLHELLAVMNETVTVAMQENGYTMVILNGTSDNIRKYGYIPDVDVIAVRYGYEGIIIVCDIDNIKGA